MIRKAAHNSTFAIGGVSCSADSFVVIGSAVLRMNICAEKPAHRKSAKRFLPLQVFPQPFLSQPPPPVNAAVWSPTNGKTSIRNPVFIYIA
jgi:hypothetical protein